MSAEGVPLNHAAIQLDRDYYTTWRRSQLLGLSWRRDTQARARLRDYLRRIP